MKKIISTICSLAMVLSMFGAFAMTADAAGEQLKLVCTTSATEGNKKAVFDIVVEGLTAGDKVGSAEIHFGVDSDFKFVYEGPTKITNLPADVVPALSDAVTGGEFVVGWTAAANKEPVAQDGTLKIATLELALADGVVADDAIALTVVDAMVTSGGSMGQDNYFMTEDNTLTAVNYTGTVGSGPKDPAITGVTVTPATATVKPGESATFTATVEGTDGSDANGATIEYNKNVTWTVEGAGTIDTNGKLTVNSDAAAGAEIKVTATSVGDSTKAGTATVKVGGAAVELTVAANADVTNYAVQNISISKAADAEQADVDAFKASVSGNKVVVLVTGKTADDVVVGSAYVIVDGTDIANGIDNGPVALGSVGITGAAKCEVSLIVNGNPVL